MFWLPLVSIKSHSCFSSLTLVAPLLILSDTRANSLTKSIISLINTSTMKFSVVSLVLLFPLSFAVPVVQISEELQIRDIADSLSEEVGWQKRDIAALTYLFEVLNTTGTGVALAETAVSVSLTQQQIITFVGSLIETKGWTELFEAAQQSGLAIDLVVMLLTHYETIPGLTNIIRAYKGESGNSSSSGILSSLFAENSNSTDSTGSSSISADYSALNDFLGSAIIATSIASDTSTSVSSTLVASDSTTTDGSGALGNLLQDLGLSTDAASSTQVSAAVTSASTSITSPTTTQSTSTATGNQLSGLLASLLGSIFKRDIGESERAKLLADLLTRADFDLENSLHLQARDAILEELNISKRDLLETVYLQIILLIGSDANIELIAESLAKSGLGVSLAYEALTNENFVDFDVNLIKYLVEKNLVSLSILTSAAIKSGLLSGIVSDILGNSTYEQLVINFVIALLTGKIDILDLIIALF